MILNLIFYEMLNIRVEKIYNCLATMGDVGVCGEGALVEETTAV